MSTPSQPMLAGHRAEVIGYAVYLDFRFPLSLRKVEEMLAARGIIASHGQAAEQIDGRQQWGLEFGRKIANRTHLAARLARKLDELGFDVTLSPRKAV